MNENVERIFKMFENSRILSILESKNNYIVSVCDEKADPNSVVENLYAINKMSFTHSEFSYFNNPDEYMEACDNVLYKYDTDELAHHGINGMKWGIRRYQNKDGSLTTAGKKRYNAELAKVRQREKIAKNKETVKGRMDRLKARQDAVAEREKALKNANKRSKKTKDEDLEKTSKTAPKKKSVKEMSDEELFRNIQRLQMEKQYESLIAKPETTSKGKAFVSDFMSKSIVPGLQEGVKSVVKDKVIGVFKKAGAGDATANAAVNAAEKYGEQAANGVKNYTDKIKESAAKHQAKQDAKSAKKEAASDSTVNSGKSAAESVFRNTSSTTTNTSSDTTSRGKSAVAGLLGPGSVQQMPSGYKSSGKEIGYVDEKGDFHAY